MYSLIYYIHQRKLKFSMCVCFSLDFMYKMRKLPEKFPTLNGINVYCPSWLLYYLNVNIYDERKSTTSFLMWILSAYEYILAMYTIVYTFVELFIGGNSENHRKPKRAIFWIIIKNKSTQTLFEFIHLYCIDAEHLRPENFIKFISLHKSVLCHQLVRMPVIIPNYWTLKQKTISDMMFVSWFCSCANWIVLRLWIVNLLIVFATQDFISIWNVKFIAFY